MVPVRPVPGGSRLKGTFSGLGLTTCTVWYRWDGGKLQYIPALKWVVEKTRSLPGCAAVFFLGEKNLPSFTHILPA